MRMNAYIISMTRYVYVLSFGGSVVSAKLVPISARVSDADAVFLARLSIVGATTPSEKLRALLADARRRHEGTQDYAHCLALMEETFAPALRRLRRLEHDAHIHSEVLKRLFTWLPDVAALLITGVPDEDENDQALKTLEVRVADRLFALFEETLHLALTTRSQCYDQQLISARIDPVLELAKLIHDKHE